MLSRLRIPVLSSRTSQHLLTGFGIKILADLKAVAMSAKLPCSTQRRAGTGAGIDNHIALVGKNLDQTFQYGNRFLRRMYLGDILTVTHPVEVVEDHVTLAVCIGIAELRQLTPIQHQCIFGSTHDSHVGFQHLWTVVFAEDQRNIILESVLFCLSDDFRDLLKRTEHDHARCVFFAFGRLLFEQS